MKKKLIKILIFTLMFIPIISVNAEDCYYKCDYSTTTGSQKCDHVTKCTTVVGSTSCTKVNSSYCKNSSNNIGTTKVSCGNITGIPKKIPELTSFAINIIQIAIPIVLVIMGSLDFFKSVIAQKEDEIKKGQKIFLKRLIYAAIIFFVIIIVKFLISIVANATDTNNISDCIDCFLNGADNCGR